jgi:hypothetical protein
LMTNFNKLHVATTADLIYRARDRDRSSLN